MVWTQPGDATAAYRVSCGRLGRVAAWSARVKKKQGHAWPAVSEGGGCVGAQAERVWSKIPALQEESAIP